MHRHLQQLQNEIGSAIKDATVQELQFHPHGKWSITEVLEHLYLTYTGTIKGFGRLATVGHSLAGKTDIWHRVATMIVLRLSYMPKGREAPSMARPKGIPAETVLTEIEAKIVEMDNAITSCVEKLGPGKLLDHPFLGPLTGTEWRKFHLVHGRHHLKQIRDLRAAYRSHEELAKSK